METQRHSMAPKRRMGPETAATRSVLMDAVEQVMREKGYATLSARSVAARAGLKYQIVFYYFETMDELLLATYRRLMQSMWVSLTQALKGERPLHALWEVWSHPTNGAVWLEFMALTNHNPVIRAEKIAFGERMRDVIVEALKRRGGGERKPFTPYALSTVMASIGATLAFENAIDMADAHAETRALVEWTLEQLEPPQAPRERAGRADHSKLSKKRARKVSV